MTQSKKHKAAPVYARMTEASDPVVGHEVIFIFREVTEPDVYVLHTRLHVIECSAEVTHLVLEHT
jgi:hypothetical protein